MNNNNNDEEKPTPWEFRVFELGSKALYIVAAFVLQLLSLAMVGMAIWSVTGEVWAGKPLLTQLLDSVVLIVITFAVFDVAKFLLEEQVLKDRELSRIAEARRSLTIVSDHHYYRGQLGGAGNYISEQKSSLPVVLSERSARGGSIRGHRSGIFQWLTNKAEKAREESKGQNPRDGA
jgi:hypothetical protein